MNYAQKLRDPRWQRKRLETLERAGWKCECCDSSTKTLHVHHKQYIKGREPWEYEDENFEALCEDCHEEAHESKDLINEILASVPSSMWPDLASLLTGYMSPFVSVETFKLAKSSHHVGIGGLAYVASFLSDQGLDAVQAAVDKAATESTKGHSGE
jgi:hypothetical protein